MQGVYTSLVGDRSADGRVVSKMEETAEALVVRVRQLRHPRHAETLHIPRRIARRTRDASSPNFRQRSLEREVPRHVALGGQEMLNLAPEGGLASSSCHKLDLQERELPYCQRAERAAPCSYRYRPVSSSSRGSGSRG